MPGTTIAAPLGADVRADVVVVGAGPAGSSAAWWMARAGLDVVVLEKAAFPREKVCGDGLTPRGVKALDDMGVDTSGWVRHKGLRVAGGGQVVEVDWPRLNPFNGEGISYAMETGRMAAETAADALARPEGLARESVLRRYPDRLRAAYGRHHRLGIGFLALLARPDVVRFATAHGLKRPALVSAALRLTGNLSDGRHGDAVDRAIAVLTRLAPAV